MIHDMNILTGSQRKLLNDIILTSHLIDSDDHKYLIEVILFTNQYSDSDKLWLNELRHQYIIFKYLKKRAAQVWPKL